MKRIPLAERLRPRNLEEFLGQRHLLDEGKVLRGMVDQGNLTSLILWGPPGCGKTTLARLLARLADANFVSFSAVLSGVKELRAIAEEAKGEVKRGGPATVLFVDEIHRFNKAQQDAFLPYVEDGTIVLIGATTENPSFEIVPPLLSRCRVLVLEPLEESDLREITRRALGDRERGLGSLGLVLDEQAEGFLMGQVDGDARTLLNVLELAAQLALSQGPGTRENLITLEHVQEALQHRGPRYDKAGEEHFNIISAFHKSLRGSDPDAALYWLARMLVAGEDPHYVARRMIRFASEDVGVADPQALQVALNALHAYDFLGSPEGELALAQAAVYLATAPKSNATYKAFGEALADAKRLGTLPVPMHIRNAPTRLMKELGYGKGYKYSHDHPDAIADQEYLPAKLKDRIYYQPTSRGYERIVKDRLEKWRKILAQRRRKAPRHPEG